MFLECVLKFAHANDSANVCKRAGAQECTVGQFA
ncbi:MAG: hypothetical protein EORIYHIE_002489 [Candidatus Fervidibacter sp.]|jgi:hypothetical protein